MTNQHLNLKNPGSPSGIFSFCIVMSLILSGFSVYAQPVYPKDWGLKRFTINDKTTGPIGFYVDTTNIKRKAPLLIFVNGSGGYPLCIYVESEKGGQLMTTFHSEMIGLVNKDYHLVLIDKPGLNFCDTVKIEGNDLSRVMETYQVPAYYNEMLSLSWRVNSIKAVISYLIKNGYHDGKKIIAWGFSEGGQVVPKLAADDKRVTHVVSVVGAGLNQFYDFITSVRVRVAKGELTHQQGQAEIDESLNTIKAIYADPTSTTKFFAGHTYKRWASFCSDVPLEHLSKLTIPIYMVVGSADVNSPIYGLDYVPLEFSRLGKKNLTYEVCVGCDHFQTIIETADEKERGKNVGREINGRILEWLGKN
jgi:pimeloyl-ACP methyl ester carboxylesterase